MGRVNPWSEALSIRKATNYVSKKKSSQKRYQNTCTARTPFPRIRVWARYGTGRGSATCPKNLDFAFEERSRWWCHVAREKPKTPKEKTTQRWYYVWVGGMCRHLIGWCLTEWQIRVSWELIWLDAKCFYFFLKNGNLEYW